MLKIATSVSNEMEAVLVRGRLSAAGIHSMLQRRGGGSGRGVGGACDVYVEERDLDQARELLNAEGISEEELTREEELADVSVAFAKPTNPEQGEPLNTLTPKEHRLFKRFVEIVQLKPKADAPENPFGS
jgi:hypothetical protein